MIALPSLPVELKRLILELVALNDPDDARSLRLVSRDINILVLPIVFRHLLIEHVADLAVFTRTVLPPPSLHHKLRNRKPDPPRLLSTYNIASLALLLPTNLPSIENALAAVGSVFSRLQHLAITSRSLSSNAFWLREHNVKPQYIMLLHHGSPRPVNWRDSVFADVTHLYTSSLDSHGRSTLCDLPKLTHLAVTTHAEHSEDLIRRIAATLEWLLDEETLPNLQSLVLGLSYFPRPPPVDAVFDYYEQYVDLLLRWRTNLSTCLSSSKFYILPDPNPPRAEWESSVIDADIPDIWDAAASYREKYPNSTVFEVRQPDYPPDWDRWFGLLNEEPVPVLVLPPPDNEMKPRRRWRPSKVDWEIDLVQRDGYHDSERLDPQEAGEFEHVLSGF